MPDLYADNVVWLNEQLDLLRYEANGRGLSDREVAKEFRMNADELENEQ